MYLGNSELFSIFPKQSNLENYKNQIWPIYHNYQLMGVPKTRKNLQNNILYLN